MQKGKSTAKWEVYPNFRMSENSFQCSVLIITAEHLQQSPFIFQLKEQWIYFFWLLTLTLYRNIPIHSNLRATNVIERTNKPGIFVAVTRTYLLAKFWSLSCSHWHNLWSHCSLCVSDMNAFGMMLPLMFSQHFTKSLVPGCFTTPEREKILHKVSRKGKK